MENFETEQEDLKVVLYKNLSGGFNAGIEDGGGDSIWLVKHETAKAACDAAAVLLREAAVRFDRLAQKRNPTLEKNQDKVNAERVTL